MLPETVAALREKDFSKLASLIDGAKKFDLFKANDDFYEQLNELRKLRNRVHIQNEKRHFERKEAVAFNALRQREAETALEYIAKFLAAEHPRGPSTQGFVTDLNLPWNEHWDFARPSRLCSEGSGNTSPSSRARGLANGFCSRIAHELGSER